MDKQSGSQESWIFDIEQPHPSAIADCKPSSVVERPIRRLLSQEGSPDQPPVAADVSGLGSQIGSTVTSGFPLTEMLQRCASVLLHHLTAESVAIWTANPVTRVLEIQASAGLFDDSDASLKQVPFGNGCIGRIVLEPKPVLHRSCRHNGLVQLQKRANSQDLSFTGYPLMVNNRVVGVLGAFVAPGQADSTFQLLAGVTHTIALGIDRLRIEASLRGIEARLRINNAALDAAAHAIVMTDAHGGIMWANPAFSRLTGYSLAEVFGKNPRVLKSGMMPESVYHELWQTIQSGNPWTGELINKHKDGSLYHQDMTITPVLTPEGVISHFIAVCQDITSRKRREEELRWKTALLEAQVDSALDGILIVDENDRHVLKNDRLAAIWKLPTGVSNVSDDRKTVEVAAHLTKNPEEFLTRVSHLYSHPNEVSRDEIELRDGTILDRYTSPVRDRSGKYYGRIWTFRDITERKKAEASMVALHRQLVDASREAGMAEVATSVLHNVGNVLNSLNVSVSFIEERIRKSRLAELHRLFELLQSQSTDLPGFFASDPRAAKVPGFVGHLAIQLSEEQKLLLSELSLLQKNVGHIKDVVAMQQSYAKVSGFIENVDVKETIEDVLRMNASVFARRDFKVACEFDSSPTLSTDKHKLIQILLNLVRNATQACDERGGDDKRVTIRVSENRDTVTISVIDNGVGIPAENLAPIFNHGFTTRKDGHGFGLHSGALAAKELGGQLNAQSQGRGKGANFTLELPKAAQVPQAKHGLEVTTGRAASE